MFKLVCLCGNLPDAAGVLEDSQRYMGIEWWEQPPVHVTDGVSPADR